MYIKKSRGFRIKSQTSLRDAPQNEPQKDAKQGLITNNFNIPNTNHLTILVIINITRC